MSGFPWLYIRRLDTSVRSPPYKCMDQNNELQSQVLSLSGISAYSVLISVA